MPDSPREARTLLEAVGSFLDHYGIRGKKVVVAVSGGPDSVALLRALHMLRERYALDLHVAHLNHMLRGEEGERDARFVAELASSLSLEIAVESRDVCELQRRRQLSVEDAARQVRYEFLNALADVIRADFIALGHTADDQAETVLLQLVRGTGLAGLRGMLPQRGRCIRPLLDVQRRDIARFLDSIRADSVADTSNLDNTFARNRMRNVILPLFREQFNPRIVESICRTARLLRSIDHWVNETVDTVYQEALIEHQSGSLRLKTGSLTDLPQYVRSLVIRKAISELCGSPPSLTSDHLMSAEKLLEAPTPGATGSLPGGIRIRKHGDELELTTTEDVGLQDWELEPVVPSVVHIPDTDIRISFEVVERSPGESMPKTLPHEAFLDFGRISGRLVLRNRRRGDRFHPLGAPGSRKLKDFFIDTKFPKSRRDRIPLLVDEKGIVCVLGYIIGDRVKVTKESRRLLHIVMSGTVPSA